MGLLRAVLSRALLRCGSAAPEDVPRGVPVLHVGRSRDLHGAGDLAANPEPAHVSRDTSGPDSVGGNNESDVPSAKAVLECGGSLFFLPVIL